MGKRVLMFCHPYCYKAGLSSDSNLCLVEFVPLNSNNTLYVYSLISTLLTLLWTTGTNGIHKRGRDRIGAIWSNASTTRLFQVATETSDGPCRRPVGISQSLWNPPGSINCWYEPISWVNSLEIKEDFQPKV